MFWLDTRRPPDGAPNPATQPLLAPPGGQQAAMPHRDARRAARALRAAWAAAHSRLQQQPAAGGDLEAGGISEVPMREGGRPDGSRGRVPLPAQRRSRRYAAPALDEALTSGSPPATAADDTRQGRGHVEGPAIQVPEATGDMMAGELAEGARPMAAAIPIQGPPPAAEIQPLINEPDQEAEIQAEAEAEAGAGDGGELPVPPTPPVGRSSWAWLSGRGRRRA